MAREPQREFSGPQTHDPALKAWEAIAGTVLPLNQLEAEQAHAEFPREQPSRLNRTQRRARNKAELLTFLGLHAKVNSYGFNFSKAACT